MTSEIIPEDDDGSLRDTERPTVGHPGPPNRELGVDDFNRDSHATKYRGEIDARPEAFDRLFGLLNDPANEQRLADAEMLGLPALTGVVRFIEADPTIAQALETGGNRFRQTVGVAIRLKMEQLGWRKTGRKRTVRGSRHFTKAERYFKESLSDQDHAKRALEALEAVARIGDEREREQTGRELMEALAATRQAEGRVF